MPDFNIQRGSFDFGATEDTDTVTLGTPVASLNQAFARITGIRFMSGGPSAGTGSQRYNDDLGVTCLLTATDTITFTRLAAGENVDYRVYWEVIEGPASGPNAIVVRYHANVSMADAVGQVDQAVAGITTLADCVPFICGVTNDQTGSAWDRVSVTLKMLDVAGDKVRLERVNSGNNNNVSVAVVEFTGANWTIENNIEHNYAAAGANETEAINDVGNIATAFVVVGHRQDGNRNDELGYNCWFKDTDELYFRIEGSAAFPGSDYTVAHVVQNDGLSVEHQNSILGGEADLPAGAANPQTFTRSVTAVADTAQTSLIATADDSDINANYPRPHWLYRLTDTDEVTWWRAWSGSTADWTLQVIQFPEGTIPTPGFMVMCA